jgi:hypothetical protein
MQLYFNSFLLFYSNYPLRVSVVAIDGTPWTWYLALTLHILSVLILLVRHNVFYWISYILCYIFPSGALLVISGGCDKETTLLGCKRLHFSYQVPNWIERTWGEHGRWLNLGNSGYAQFRIMYYSVAYPKICTTSEVPPWIVIQVAKAFSTFYETEIFFTVYAKPRTETCPRQSEFSSYPHTHVSQNTF